MNDTPVEIVRATFSDARSIAEVHVASWKTTYRGIIDDDFLNRLSVDKRTLSWENILKVNEDKYTCLLAKQGERIIGFGDAGKARDLTSNFDAELYAIYLLENSTRKGVGTLLVKQLFSECMKNGLHSMITWMAEKNESKYFYEALGARLLPLRKVSKIGPNEIVEIAYGWDKIPE